MVKVWHISRFRQRYELSEDVRLDRKSPLIYTKDFVGGGSDDDSCAHFRQMMALRSKPCWLMLRGAFAELKNVAGNMSKEYRGYLLDSNFKPASVKEIGRWLGVSEKKAKKIIEELSDIGLLEHVALPRFNSEPQKRTGKSGRARGSPAKSGAKRKRTGKPGKERAPFKKKANTKVKVNGKGKNKGEQKRQDESQQEDPAPTTQPIKPQVSAKEGSMVQSAVPPELKNTEMLGDISKKILHRYSPEAKEFGFEIYRALEPPWDPTSEQGKRELGCFASAWQKVGDIPGKDELRSRGIAEARKIAKRRQNRKKGAVWCTVFKNLVAAKLR